jgi:hypothetical protein
MSRLFVFFTPILGVAFLLLVPKAFRSFGNGAVMIRIPRERWDCIFLQSDCILRSTNTETSFLLLDYTILFHVYLDIHLTSDSVWACTTPCTHLNITDFYFCGFWRPRLMLFPNIGNHLVVFSWLMMSQTILKNQFLALHSRRMILMSCLHAEEKFHSSIWWLLR